MTQKPGKRTTTEKDKLTLLRRSRQAYPDHPDKGTLEAFANTHPGREYTIEFDCPEFTSLCPVTAQPDFGHITIRYVPDKLCIESKSLKIYLFSYRNHGTFHEAAVNRILDDVVAAIRPVRVEVTGTFRPRGGIAIKVVASHPSSNRPRAVKRNIKQQGRIRA